MDIFQAIPAGVAFVSIALTELLKNFITEPRAKKVLMNLIWLPSMLVGVCAAYFEVENFFTKEGIWLAITYGILGPFIVLVLKPIIRQVEEKKNASMK